MLGYKISKNFGEIMMTHGGDDLEHWQSHIKTQKERIGFAAEMLRQIMHALKTLHACGYAHGDIKPENICARMTKENKIKFTLIDFGLCQKMPPPGQKNNIRNKSFRGNFMFCSDRQLERYKPTVFCDLVALLNVAYYFIHKETPSTEFATLTMLAFPKKNIFQPFEFKTFRLLHKRRFELELMSKNNPFHALAKYIFDVRDQQQYREKQLLKKQS